MSMEEIVRQIGKEISRQREDEQKILNEIAAATDIGFARQAAGALDPRKHIYGFEAYLMLLGDLKTLLYAGMPGSLALESVQCGHGAETILTMWRYAQNGQTES